MGTKQLTFPRHNKCDCGRLYIARRHYEYVYGCPTCRAMNKRMLKVMVDPYCHDYDRTPSPEAVYGVLT